MTDEESPKTVGWEMCVWVCPHCGLEGDDGLPAHLELVDSRDPDVSLTDAWNPEFSPDLYQRAHATETAVYCHVCDTVFNVTFDAREEDCDE